MYTQTLFPLLSTILTCSLCLPQNSPESSLQTLSPDAGTSNLTSPGIPTCFSAPHVALDVRECRRIVWELISPRGIDRGRIESWGPQLPELWVGTNCAVALRRRDGFPQGVEDFSRDQLTNALSTILTQCSETVSADYRRGGSVSVGGRGSRTYVDIFRPSGFLQPQNGPVNEPPSF